MRQARLTDVLMLVAIAAGVLLPALGQTHRLASREMRHAEIIREMAESGDYLVPTLLGKTYPKKPPVMHAIAAKLTQWADEPSMWLNRLPSAVAGILGVLVTYGLGIVLYDRRVGLVAGIALLGVVGYSSMARQTRPDMILCVTVLSACLALGLGMRDRRPVARNIWFVLAGLATGLGLVTKGPFGLLVPMLFVWFAPILRPELARPRWGWVGYAVALLGLVALWAVPAYLYDHGKYLHAVLFQPDLDVSTEEKSRVFLVYLWEGLAYSMPLVLFLPLAIVDLRRAFSAPLSMAGALLFVVSCIPKKRPHYLITLYPFLTLGIAAAIVRHSETTRWVRRAAWVVVSLSVIAMPVYYAGILPRLHPGEDTDLAVARGVLGAIEPNATVYSVKGYEEELAWLGRRKEGFYHLDDRDESAGATLKGAANTYLLIPEGRMARFLERIGPLSLQPVWKQKTESDTVLLFRIGQSLPVVP